jgi:DNA-binding NtrC family response regulator
MMTAVTATPTTARRAPARAILVVDDEPSICELLRLALADGGHTVEAAADVGAAIARIDEARFDIAMIDKNLPDGSGFDVARHLARRQPACEMILMTGYPSRQSAVEALRLGMAEYLEKPLDLDALHECLGRVVELQERRR